MKRHYTQSLYPLILRSFQVLPTRWFFLWFSMVNPSVRTTYQNLKAGLPNKTQNIDNYVIPFSYESWHSKLSYLKTLKKKSWKPNRRVLFFLSAFNSMYDNVTKPQYKVPRINKSFHVHIQYENIQKEM